MSSKEQFTITRRIEIDAAHRVPHHGSKCFKVHGHRYVIEATCIGDLITEGEQTGMVMDFGFLKQCMTAAIHDQCDHGIILWEEDPMIDSLHAGGKGGISSRLVNPDIWWKIYYMTSVPTAENLAKEWYCELQTAINGWFGQYDAEIEPPKLMQVKVWETPNCSAVYPW